MARVLAFAIHVLTASGTALALLALIFAVGGHWAAMFLTLGVALLVDGVDGPLARQFEVQRLVPRWSGDALDLVVDFTTYVFVPAYAIAASGLLPESLAIPAGAVVCVTGALYFADRNMKTADNYFSGFPAVWNVIAFYLYALRPSPWLAAAMIAAFAVLTFLPIKFAHPLRVKSLRIVSIATVLIWAALAAMTVVYNLDPPVWVLTGLCIIAVYFLTAGLFIRRA